MATSRSFDEFSQRMAFQAKSVSTGVEKAVRRAALAADTAAVLHTPVDTGRARGNWLASIGVPRTEQVDIRDQAQAQAEAAESISRWRLGMGSIFLSNSVPYIMALDQGSSAQSPNGMSTFAVAAAKRQLGKVRLLK